MINNNRITQFDRECCIILMMIIVTIKILLKRMTHSTKTEITTTSFCIAYNERMVYADVALGSTRQK